MIPGIQSEIRSKGFLIEKEFFDVVGFVAESENEFVKSV